jgi:hypothetical protein
VRVVAVHGAGEWTGRARATFDLARGLAARGAQVAVAAVPGIAASRAEGLGLRVAELAAGSRALRNSLRAVLQSMQADVVLVSDADEHAAAAAAAGALGRGLIVRRTPAGERGRPTSRERRDARRIATLYLPGDRTEAQRAAIPPRAVVGPACEPTIDLSIVPMVPPPLQGHLLIVCGRGDVARAGVHNFLRAVAPVARRHSELRALLVGPGAHDDDLRVHAAALGVADRVGVGAREADDAWALGNASLACILAPGDDGAFAILDCMARQIPVFGERDPVVARLVADGITGELYPAGDAPAAAAALAELLGDVPRRASMGYAARLRAAREFSPAASVESIERAIVRALAGGSAA